LRATDGNLEWWGPNLFWTICVELQIILKDAVGYGIDVGTGLSEGASLSLSNGHPAMVIGESSAQIVYKMSVPFLLPLYFAEFMGFQLSCLYEMTRREAYVQLIDFHSSLNCWRI